MDVLTRSRYLDLVRGDLAQVRLNSSHERRIGAHDHAELDLAAIRSDLDEFVPDVGSDGDLIGQIADLALEAGSLLFSVGAGHPEWRHWIGLAGVGQLLLGQVVAACPLLVLGGEWVLIDQCRQIERDVGTPAAMAVWRLAKHSRVLDDLPDDDEVDKAWRKLVVAVPAGDASIVSQSLNQLAEFWIAEYEEDWRIYHPRTPPDFEPEVCAAAAVARREGYDSYHLETASREFLDAGLAEGWPDQIGNRWRLPDLSTTGDE